jgi:hypothetical protein
MDVYDKNNNIKKIILDKGIFNYQSKKKEFSNNLCFFEDKDLINILKLNYLNYGIICKSIILEKDKNVSGIYFTKKNIISKNILEPKILFEKINDILMNLKNIISIIEKNYKIYKEYDIKIFNKIIELRNNNFIDYLTNLLDLNNLRLCINNIFFEYHQDISFYYNKFTQLKYDFLITEDNIESLISIFIDLNSKLEKIYLEKIILLTENNSKKFFLKNEKGNINLNDLQIIINKIL